MPKNWKTYKLGTVADIQNGYAFKSSELEEFGPGNKNKKYKTSLYYN